MLNSDIGSSAIHPIAEILSRGWASQPHSVGERLLYKLTRMSCRWTVSSNGTAGIGTLKGTTSRLEPAVTRRGIVTHHETATPAGARRPHGPAPTATTAGGPPLGELSTMGGELRRSPHESVTRRGSARHDTRSPPVVGERAW